MSYQIDYTSGGAKVHDFPPKRRNGRAIGIAILLAFLFFLHSLFPTALDVIRDFLIPGDAAVTAAAFDSLVASVQSGESCAQAFTAFCREIIDSAEDPV